MTTTDFRKAQRGVAIGMGAALCVTVLVSAVCLRWGMAAPRPVADRLNVTAKADMLVLVWLAAAIGNVARLRFVSADDIAGSAAHTGTAAVRRANALLQNTLEQVTLAIPVHALLAILVPASVPLVVAFAALFAVGRLLFWIGYADGAQARAFGFALTFYSSVAGLVIGIGAALRTSL